MYGVNCKVLVVYVFQWFLTGYLKAAEATEEDVDNAIEVILSMVDNVPIISLHTIMPAYTQELTRKNCS